MIDTGYFNSIKIWNFLNKSLITKITSNTTERLGGFTIINNRYLLIGSFDKTIKEYMNKKPLDLAKEIIHSIDIKIKLKYPKIIKKKILLNYNSTNMNTKKNKYQNSTSRISTSNYCNNNKEQIVEQRN